MVYGTNNKWIKNPRFGSSNFIFIEDNIFDYHRHSVAAGGCALYVARHNTITNDIITSGYSSALDGHEARGAGNGSNTYGTRAVEAYSNKIYTFDKFYTNIFGKRKSIAGLKTWFFTFKTNTRYNYITGDVAVYVKSEYSFPLSVG